MESALLTSFDRLSTTEDPKTHSQASHLPAEIFSIIGGFLAGDLCFRTLADLNVASRAINEETLAVLYDTIILKWSNNVSDVLKGDKGKGWKYVR